MTRLKAAWSILLGRESRKSAHATVVVSALVFGRVRRVALQSRRGNHAIGVAADGGPTGIYLVSANQVLAESRDDFELFMAACHL